MKQDFNLEELEHHQTKASFGWSLGIKFGKKSNALIHPHAFLGVFSPQAKSTELVEPLATFITGFEVDAEADAWLDA